MKFEKFFKAVGTHGLIVKKSDTESWLVCDGVGMRIPRGVNNLGIATAPSEMFTAIVNSESDDDTLVLKEALLLDPEGKAKDIVRVFETEQEDYRRVYIWNSEYGFLEKKDRLTYLEIEDEEEKIHKFMVIRNHDGDAIGYITNYNVNLIN